MILRLPVLSNKRRSAGCWVNLSSRVSVICSALSKVASFVRVQHATHPFTPKHAPPIPPTLLLVPLSLENRVVRIGPRFPNAVREVGTMWLELEMRISITSNEEPNSDGDFAISAPS